MEKGTLSDIPLQWSAFTVKRGHFNNSAIIYSPYLRTNFTKHNTIDVNSDIPINIGVKYGILSRKIGMSDLI